MPAVSERQRRWAFAVKGPAWARRHHFDKLDPFARARRARHRKHVKTTR